MRENYGIGSSSQAVGNRNRIENDLNQMFRNTANVGMSNADQTYATQAAANRQNAARSGLLGSSQDSQAQGGNLANYLRNRRVAVANASGMRQNARNQLNSQRIGLEQGVQSGTIANPNFQNIAMQQQQALNAQQANIVPGMIGAGLNMAGNIYSQHQYQRGRGNRGFSFGGGSNSGGTIT